MSVARLDQDGLPGGDGAPSLDPVQAVPEPCRMTADVDRANLDAMKREQVAKAKAKSDI